MAETMQAPDGSVMAALPLLRTTTAVRPLEPYRTTVDSTIRFGKFSRTVVCVSVRSNCGYAVAAGVLLVRLVSVNGMRGDRTGGITTD